MSVPDSIVAAINTSGRAVLFAGTTVCIAILGLIALGVSFFNGMAVGAAVAVGLTMVASLTLLPALLSLLGLKVLPRKQRRAVRAGQFIDVHADRILGPLVASSWPRRKVALGLAGAAVIVALAIPFFSLRLGQGDQGNDPSSTTTRKGYDLIAQGFGVGYNSTLEAVVDGPGATDPAYLQKVGQTLAATPGVDPASVAPDPAEQHGSRSCRSSRPPRRRTRRPTTWSSTCAPTSCRRSTTERRTTSTSTATPRSTSTSPRCSSAKMPLFIAAVVGLSFLLLMIAFRSLVIPLTAAVMNLLAAGASFGIVVAIFQWGWGSDGARRRQGRPDRRLGTGDVLRDPVRPVDGLPGVPGQPDARGVGAHRGQRAGRSPSARPRPAASSPPPRSS